MAKTVIFYIVVLSYLNYAKATRPTFTSKMCNPFFPEFKPLPEKEVKRYQLHRCFSLNAYPLGKRNHVHVTFQQWPLIDNDDCKHFTATNISLQAFNKYAWPFGHWLISSSENSSFCIHKDDVMMEHSGFVEDCHDLLKSEYVEKNLMSTVSQDTLHRVPGRNVNMFMYGFSNNEGGACTTWRYLGTDFSAIAAAELGGLTNAKEYFSNFHVTFLAELLVIPSKETKLPPFLYTIQTKTFKFNGNYSVDHHTSQCHRYHRTNKNFQRQFYTQDLNHLHPQYVQLMIKTSEQKKSKTQHDKLDSNTTTTGQMTEKSVTTTSIPTMVKTTEQPTTTTTTVKHDIITTSVATMTNEPMTAVTINQSKDNSSEHDTSERSTVQHVTESSRNQVL